MGPGNSRTYSINRQRTALLKELAQCGERIHAARTAVRAAYPAACKATQDMRPAFDAGLDELRRSARHQARKGTWGQALSLRALFHSKVLLLIAWAMLGLLALLPQLAISTFASHLPQPMQTPFDLLVGNRLVPVALYALLVWLGRLRLSRQLAKPALTAINALGKRQLQLHAFGQKHLDGRSHPYPVVRAPATAEDQLSVTWQLNNGQDNSNAVMVGVSQDLASDPEAFIRLPINDKPGGYVRAQNNVDSHFRFWWPAFAELAPKLTAFAQPILDLQRVSTPLERELQIEKSILDRLASLDLLEASWKDVAIPEDTLAHIIQLVDRFIAGNAPLPKGILLWGPPGTGKTLIARKLAEHVNCNFMAVTIADLKAPHIGHTAPQVTRLWEEARSKGPTLLFVDECETTFATRGSRDSDSFGAELVQTFISEWDGFKQGGNVLVIGATNRRELIDNAVMSRFTTAIELPAPDAEARERILAAEFAHARLELLVTEALVRDTSGLSGRDLSTLVTRVVSSHPAGRPSLEDFSAAVVRLRGKSVTAVQALTWDEIILPASTRAEFESLGQELLHAEELAKLNIPPPRGILLYGPPGTGKTQIARVLASQSGLSFIAASSAEVKGQFLGDGGSKVQQLFEKARSQAPCIVFLDEIDTIAPPRDGASADKLTTEVVAQLLQELDGVSHKNGQVFLLAASNHLGSIDSSLLSRLERKIEIGLPDVDARSAILRLQLAGKPLGFDVEEVLPELAAATAGRSGRDLQSLITAGTRRALQRALLEHGDPTKLMLRPDDLLPEIASSVVPA